VFNSRGGEVFIAIGIVRSLLFHPRSHSGCSISIYRVLDNRLVLLHTTDVPDLPLAMCEFQVEYIHTLFSAKYNRLHRDLRCQTHSCYSWYHLYTHVPACICSRTPCVDIVVLCDVVVHTFILIYITIIYRDVY
jgi:hypothetical protein